MSTRDTDRPKTLELLFVCIAAEALNRCESIDDLTALVREHCLT